MVKTISLSENMNGQSTKVEGLGRHVPFVGGDGTSNVHICTRRSGQLAKVVWVA
jgi:hypothetical protein